MESKKPVDLSKIDAGNIQAAKETVCGKFALIVAAHAEETEGGLAKFDFASIIAIITGIITALQNCKKTPAAAAATARAPSVLMRVLARRQVHKVIKDNDHAETMYGVLMDHGRVLHTEEMALMYNEVKPGSSDPAPE